MIEIRLRGKLANSIINSGKKENDKVKISFDKTEVTGLITTLTKKIKPNIQRAYVDISIED